MIRVSHLTKRYPGRTAVDNISFDVPKGEIAGFLGPNGAGKTTTLRMLAGYLPASGGEAYVAGYSVAAESMEVRRRIGYLPENAPLYPDQRVDEYLFFRARLKGLPVEEARERMEETKQLCGLRGMGRRIIGQLSKGYRQRVGLADALLGDPELLLLDEPTAGLDPVQIRQVRELILQLGKRHTILLSTHILPEAEAMCSRVIILGGGQILAADTPAALRARLASPARLSLEFRGAPDVVAALAAIPGVVKVQPQPIADGLRVMVQAERGTPIAESVYDVVRGRGWALRELHAERESLDEVFVELTRGKLEDPGS